MEETNKSVRCQDNFDEENIQDVLEQIKKTREETTKDGKVFTILPEYR